MALLRLLLAAAATRTASCATIVQADPVLGCPAAAATAGHRESTEHRTSASPAATNASASDSLVPRTRSTAPHYYTTWGTQGYMPGDCWHNLTVAFIFGHQGMSQQESLCSDYLFGKPGLPGGAWLKSFYPSSRAELYFMLDQGYATGDGQIEPSTARFPQWNQSDPAERLRSFNDAVKALGWRGLGLWNRMSDPEYAVQAANWSKHAGITYWKIDGPDNDCACSNAAKAVFPELIVEHGFCPVSGCPLNDPSGGKVYPRSAAESVMHTLGCSDVFRSCEWRRDCSHDRFFTSTGHATAAAGPHCESMSLSATHWRVLALAPVMSCCLCCVCSQTILSPRSPFPSRSHDSRRSWTSRTPRSRPGTTLPW
jgi:hypothetical protein